MAALPHRRAGLARHFEQLISARAMVVARSDTCGAKLAVGVSPPAHHSLTTRGRQNTQNRSTAKPTPHTHEARTAVPKSKGFRDGR